ncbi:spore protease YyaC [Ammoniphilus sp. CFH 90114]|uniref:spore protease YyaC n=1 Tax=Ammoniphilus sp. CFH 90114 TaxID=2493665 RepID=UPI0013E93EB6|nr:spore protease YyaC [Ammoniphilus sp. CFH 90114]
MFGLLRKIFPKRKTKSINKTEWDVLRSFAEVIPSQLNRDDVVFFCIGTNRVSGDCFGPLVGSYLKSNGYKNVYGTIHDPIDAKNITKKWNEIPKGKFVIAIDAALGTFSYIESFAVFSGPLRPGAGIGKDLPGVGDIGILGVVNLKDWKSDSQILSQTSLSLVIPMVITLSSALMKRFPIPQQRTVNVFEEDVEVITYLKHLKGEYYSPLLG